MCCCVCHRRWHRMDWYGEKYDAYRTAEEQYDKILEYQDFYQTLNVATWEMEDVMLGAYLIQGESREMTPEVLFSTYSTKKETFQPETLSKLVDTGEVTYHSIHQTATTRCEK